jgi:phospho-N-acetylmuramoyl-pentapeptide-transferase
MEPGTEIISLIKVLLPATITFFVGIALTYPVAHYLYKHHMWKKKARTEALGGGGTPIFNSLHKEKEVGTPRMGGVVIWASVIIVTILFWLLATFLPGPGTTKLNFLSANQTWLLLFTLITASLVGFLDDLLQIRGRGTYVAGGLSLSRRIALLLVIGAVGAWWFYFKLDQSSVFIPLLGEWHLGLYFIPFFMLVMLALFSGGVIDGLDGLAGGVMASIFGSYAAIAFTQNQIDIAAFSAVLAGGTLAFLWFNIPPARFYMGETGMIGLTATLAVIAFLTRNVVPLLLIAFPLFISSASVCLQLISKKLRNGKKIFLVAPLHHHFEALGWPSYKVTMRFWVVSLITALLGLVLAIAYPPTL